jgi:DNA-entry nuclease
VDLKRILRILLPALLFVLVLLGFFRVRAVLLSHVYAPEAQTDYANATISPSAPYVPCGDTTDVSNAAIPPAESSDSVFHLEASDSGAIGGGQTEDGFAIPVYNGDEFVPINNNVPDFTEEEIGTEEFYEFSELDELGRAGCAWGCIGPSMLATEERGSIGMIRPSGWHTVKYDFVDGLYLYNRCHLIAFSLCGVNADERNLITGTRYLNIEGMLGIENRVYWYVKDTGNHVLYRVTPRYIGDDLLAVGVQMEAYSVEDRGERLSLNMFCFNVQPGVLIDYKTGDNRLDPNYETSRSISAESDPEISVNEVGQFANDAGQCADDAEQEVDDAGLGATESGIQSGEKDINSKENEPYVPDEKVTYIINTNSGRFHLPECQSVQDMKEKNRKEFFGTREELVDAGYKPCGRCNP